MHPRIREKNDRIQEQLDEVGEVQRQRKLEREQHFVELYGPNLGRSATRFSFLSDLDDATEAEERLILAEEVSAAVIHPAESMTNHPIDAVIEATELRTQANYVPPERRVWKGIPGHMYIPQSDTEFEETSESDSPPHRISQSR